MPQMLPAVKAAPNTTPPLSRMYSASSVNTPPEVESFRMSSFLFQAANTAGMEAAGRRRRMGQTAVQRPQRMQAPLSITG